MFHNPPLEAFGLLGPCEGHSGAILGAGLDGLIGLYREGPANEARLCVTGRDLEDVEMAVGWTGSGWAYLGGPEIIGKMEKKRKVIETLRETEEASATAIAEELHIHFSTAKKALEEMVEEGTATKKEERTRGRPTIVYTYVERLK